MIRKDYSFSATYILCGTLQKINNIGILQRRSLKKSFNKKTWINLRYLTRYRIDISTILNYNSRPNREPQARIFRRKKIIINYLSKNEVSLLPSREEFIPLLPEQPLLEGGAPLHRPLHPLHLLLLHAHRAFVSNLNQNIINNDICLPFYIVYIAIFEYK